MSDGVATDVSALLSDLQGYLGGGGPVLSLPPEAFTSVPLWELERSRVFGRSWVLVAHGDELGSPGSYVALSVAGEPVMVTRDGAGVLHALSPVCRHRLMPLVEPGAGSVDALVCPYHLWRYGLDGRLLGATFMRDNPDFDPGACRLPEFAVVQWHGFVFVNLDAGAQPLLPHLRRVGEELANYGLDDMVQVGSWVEDWNCNWKIAVENAHENYHVIGFHPETLQPTTPGGAETTVRADSPWVDVMRVSYREPLERGILPLSTDQLAHLYNLFVYPSGSMAASGDMVIWISFVPSAIDRTQVRGGILMPAAMVAEGDREAIRKQAEDYAAMINQEDQRGLEAVQRVAGSRFNQRGHLSTKEPGVTLFYRNLARSVLRGPGEWPGGL